ncbi:Gfo/Idh/MocA family oxidoreductase [Microbacterium lacus]|uniref:Gfo/Idh/MocA family protein n=1 Tax=Microbacterium lacus TaxID=415217 RepID=UPI00384C77ED
MRVGVLGAARIVKAALLEPSRGIAGVEVTAIAARDRDRAVAGAERGGIPRVHGSYVELLADPDIDAVYVPLPAALHARWTIAAIQAGKHVLCEKPFTSNSEAAQRVAHAADGTDRRVMEAYHSHYHPLYGRLREILGSGEIGAVRSARATFCIPIPPGRDIRWNPALAGGGLLDVGYYPVRILTELFGSSPKVTRARSWRQGEIDRRVEATLRFDGEVTGEIVSSMWSSRLFSMGLKVVGDAGEMRVSFPYHPQMGTRIRVKSATGRRTERTDARSTYSYQLEHFRDAVRSGGPVETDAAAAVLQMRTLDQIYLAAGMRPRSEAGID